MIQATLRWLSVMMMLSDIIAISIALLVAYLIRFSPLIHDSSISHAPLSAHIIGLFFILPLYSMLSILSGLYRSREIYQLRELFSRTLRAHTIGTLILLSILFVIKEINYSRWMIVIFYVLTPTFTVFGRVLQNHILEQIRNRDSLTIRAAIIGTGDLAQHCAKQFSEKKQLGYRISGLISLNFNPSENVLGTVDNLEQIITENALDEIFIALPMSQWDVIGSIILKCEYIGVKAQIVPDLKPFLTSKPSVDIIEGIPIINIRAVPLDDPLNNMIKRGFDIAFSLAVLICCSPLFLLIGIAIKLSSPGPILFKQVRVGINRKQFTMYKFRTMKMADSTTENTGWTVKNDPRRTVIGQLLRTTSLDEFPQFYNVLKGEMSIVGPRPERPFFVEKFKESVPNYMIKHHVRPGITGWAQINGWRGDTDIDKRIEHDLFYIEQWHFAFDFLIIMKTPFCGMINKNAY